MYHMKLCNMKWTYLRMRRHFVLTMKQTGFVQHEESTNLCGAGIGSIALDGTGSRSR